MKNILLIDLLHSKSIYFAALINNQNEEASKYLNVYKTKLIATNKSTGQVRLF